MEPVDLFSVWIDVEQVEGMVGHVVLRKGRIPVERMEEEVVVVERWNDVSQHGS